MKALITVLVSVAVFFGLQSIIPTEEEMGIYDSTVRLHVLANSDSPEDQSLKLMVRDEILEYSKTLGEFEGVESAEETYSHELEKIKEIAKEVIISQGYDYPVDVSLGYEYYPTRQYEDVSLPAGEYLSLKVMIGGAAGQNWWCVLYPPLCISAASADEELIDAGFTPEQMQIITDGESTRYKVKFKILESAQKLWNLLKK